MRNPPTYQSDSNVLRVCAWCWPRNTIFHAFPGLSGLKLRLNHTICPECSKRMNPVLSEDRNKLDKERA